MAKQEYIVVFRYTKDSGGYEGVVIWTCFLSKEDFDMKREKFLLAQNKEVVAEGVTAEEAIALVRQTPFASRIRAALQAATMPDGKVNDEILRIHLMHAVFADVVKD